MKSINKSLILIALAGLLLTLGCDKEEDSAVKSEYITVSNTTSPTIPVEHIKIEVISDNMQPKVSTSDNDQEMSVEEQSGTELSDTELVDLATDSTGENTEGVDSLEQAEAQDTTAGEAVENTDEVAAQTEESAGTSVIAPVQPGSIENVVLNPAWLYADFSLINTGSAVMYRAAAGRKGIVIGVNAGHGTKGGTSVKTYCHPDMSPKVTGGTTAAGSITSVAVSSGMAFNDGTSEASVNLRQAQLLRDLLLANGYDVLMLRDGSDVQLDNVARTVISNNMANCHIAIHWDGDGLSYDKGCFYISTPDGIKSMEPVASTWPKSDALGKSLINGLASKGCKLYKNGSMAVDLTQTSFSTIPSIDIELGNAASSHDDATLSRLAEGMLAGINAYYGL